MADNIVGDTQELIDGANGSAVALGLVNSAVKETQNLFSEFASKLGDVGGVLNGTSQMTRTMANSATVLSAAIFKSAEAFKSFGAAGNLGFQSMSAPMDVMIGKAEQAAAAAFTAFGKKIPSGVQATINSMKDLSATMQGAQNMQNAYIQMMMASGQATQLFTSGGADLSHLGGILANTTDSIQNATKTLAISAEEAGKFYQEMGQIPGALNKMTDADVGAVGGMNAWVAAAQLAHGAGMSLGEAITQQTKAYDQFGKVGTPALEFMARQAELSQQLGIPLTKATGFIDSMADSFKFLGDNTKGTSQIMMDMFQRLRESGVGVGPAIEQIKGMTEAMTNMSVAQKAFLSSRTGGPGGLMGAMQIEKDLKEGKTAEVFDKMKKSMMQQFGGHIVTLDEATKSQAAASQFQRQRELLKSGTLGIKAGSDEQATNILNAMTKAGAGKTPADQKTLLNSILNQGKSAEEINKTLLTGQAADIRSLKEKGGLETLAMLKHIAGVTNEQAKQMLKEERDISVKESAETTTAAEKGGETSEDTNATMTGKTIKHISDRFSGIGDSIKSWHSKPGGDFTNAHTAAEQSATQASQRSALKGTLPAAAAAQISRTTNPNAQYGQTAAHAAAVQAAQKKSEGAMGPAAHHVAQDSGKQPITVVANVYVDGKLVQKTTSHQMAHDLGDHQSNPGY